ncbi:hypothetical protein CO2235_10218 [Cupriavidus oxalaticus]|uniref:Uncharacterized protein n=1 Tax=Cupriavidus oxalaticus TaxID=96344 RepID=A0A375FR86_9BURK|nr:hypothetical protein CO2235_10218 [Cupriavidus oxalaticus]
MTLAMIVMARFLGMALTVSKQS